MKYSFKLGNYICQKAGGPNINEVLNLSDEKLLEKLNSQVGALDNLERTDAIYKGILVVEVKEVSLHPNADKLKVVKIYDNEVAVGLARDDNGYIQVVCGAPNVKVGMFVAWIPPGVTVPETFNDEEPFTLSTLKLRDQISNGMLASERELALGSDHAGILDIGKRLGSNQIIKSGDSLVSVLKLDDVIADFENKMFTHRPDCFGHLGIAREVAAIQGLKFKSPQWYLDIPEFPEGDDTKLNVSILTKNCTKYRATIIEDVKIGSSPLWMQSTFRRLGMNPINNLVDITNYMMILTAQPQHAFDLDKIKSLTGSNEAEIIIRDANDNEEITLLNGRTIKLNKDDIVIATPTKAIALAGVMGGAETEVDENTKNVLLETAAFDMYAIRRTSMRHGIFTDAVTRYTKGQPAGQIDAVSAHASEMFAKLAGGKISLSVSDGKAEPQPSLSLRPEKLNSVLGTNLDADQISEILKRVEIGVEKEKQSLIITSPFWRTDLEKEEDVIEEVGRIYGFNNIEPTLQSRQISPASVNQFIKLKDEIRKYLAGLGANEALNYSFVHFKLIDAANQDASLAFKIRNALSPDLQYYRLSLTPSLLSQVHKNIKDGFSQFALFEIGKAHVRGHLDAHEDQVPAEFTRLSLVVASNSESSEAAYYTAAAYLRGLFDHLNIKFNLIKTDGEFFGDKIPVTAPFSHVNSATVFINEKPSGIIGTINDETSRKLKLPKASAAFEIDLHQLVDLFNTDVKYKPLQKFPGVNQDVTLEVPSWVGFSSITEKVSDIINNSDLDYELKPVSIYQSSQNSGFKNITFNIYLSHPEKTLTKQDANEVIGSILTSFDKS